MYRFIKNLICAKFDINQSEVIAQTKPQRFTVKFKLPLRKAIAIAKNNDIAIELNAKNVINKDFLKDYIETNLKTINVMVSDLNNSFYNVNLTLASKDLYVEAQMNSHYMDIDKGVVVIEPKKNITTKVYNYIKKVAEKKEIVINEYDIEDLLNAIINLNIGNNDAIRRIRSLARVEFLEAKDILHFIVLLLRDDIEKQAE